MTLASVPALTGVPLAAAGSIPARFLEMVRAFPGRPAVASRTVRWSYEELDAERLRVTAALVARALDPRRPVLLYLETDGPLIAALLGVLGAGLFYAPLDPAFPPERAAALADLAGPCAVVTRRGLREAASALVPASVPVLEIDGLPDVFSGGMEGLPEVSPEAPAYLLFSSGSTGDSKGIVQTHRSVLANAGRRGAGLRLSEADRLTLLTSASYGASASGIFGALLHGAAVLPYAPRTATPDAWRDWAAAEEVTVWHSVPGLFRSLARTVDDPGRLPALRLFQLGGEPAFAVDFELFQRRFREGTAFHVGLGLTEVNVVCQWTADHGTACPGPVLPVGRPLAGIEVALLGPDGESPAVEEGELCLISATLPAYWRRPDLTARAFRPVEGRPGERLFRTGDLVRRLPDGNLLHLGRRDRQLKVRGLGVDAAAVEAALRGVPGVCEAAVDVRTNGRGERELVAWIVADGVPSGGQGLPPLQARLAGLLPPEAVPGKIVAVTELPLLGPGKVDRGRLPDPPPGRRELDAPFVASAGAGEAAVAGVFAAVVGVESVGALDDFFELGGSSLRALDALVGLEEALGCPADAALFVGPPGESTPRRIARLLADRDGVRGLAVPLAEGLGPAVFYVPGHGGGEGPDLLQIARIARRAALPGPSFALRLPPDLPESPEALLEAWLEAVLAVRGGGPWGVVALCAGGPLGLALAGRLGAHGPVHLILHDAQFPTRTRRLRRLLLRLREPWGDNLAVRLRHHLGRLREIGARSLAAAVRYAAARGRSAVHGVQRMAIPAVQRLVSRQAAYLRLAQACRPGTSPAPAQTTLLIVTPARRAQGLPELWRRVVPGLAVRHTGEDAERETAEEIRELFALVLAQGRAAQEPAGARWIERGGGTISENGS